MFRVAFSPDGKHLAACDKEGLVRTWEIAGGTSKVVIENDEWITDIVFSRDGSHIITSGSEVVLWDATTGAESRRYPIRAISLALSPDGAQLACSHHMTITVLDLSSGETMATLKGLSGESYGMAFSADGKLLAAASLNGAVQVWSIPDGVRIHAFHGHDAAGYRVAFTADSSRLVSVGGDYSQSNVVPGEAHIWDVTSGKHVRSLRGHVTAVTDVAFHLDEQRVATVERDGNIKIWDVTASREFQLLISKGGGDSRSNLAFSSDGQYLATPQGNVLMVWDTTFFNKVRAPTGTPKRGVKTTAFRPKRTQVAFTDNLGVLRVTDVASGQELFNVQTPNGYDPAVFYSPDGRQIITVGRTSGAVWDADTGANVDVFSGSAFATSVDGGCIALAKDGAVTIWSTATERKVLLELNQSPRPTLRAVDTAGATLATGGPDKVARLWDIDTGREIANMTGHVGAITGISIHPDGQRIATCSTDTSVKLWDVESGQELLTFRPSIGALHDVAFSPCGRLLATRNLTATVAVWDAGNGGENVHRQRPVPISP